MAKEKITFDDIYILIQHYRGVGNNKIDKHFKNSKWKLGNTHSYFSCSSGFENRRIESKVRAQERSKERGKVIYKKVSHSIKTLIGH